MQEFEFKRMLTRKQYDFLANPNKLKKIKNVKRRVQINYYYDTLNTDFRRKGTTIRIRQTEGGLKGIVKERKRIGSYHVSEEKEFSFGNNRVESSDVKKGRVKLTVIPESLDYRNERVTLKGQLTTERTVIPLKEGIHMMLDCNYYLGRTDYELELEFTPENEKNAVKYMADLEQIFSVAGIPFISNISISKPERFYRLRDKFNEEALI